MERYIKQKIKQLEIINKSPHNNEYWKGQIDAYNEIFEHLLISGVSKSLLRKDAEFIYSLLPDWVKSKAPEGLYPTMYGTLSKEGDEEIRERANKILGNA